MCERLRCAVLVCNLCDNKLKLGAAGRCLRRHEICIHDCSDPTWERVELINAITGNVVLTLGASVKVSTVVGMTAGVVTLEATGQDNIQYILSVMMDAIYKFNTLGAEHQPMAVTEVATIILDPSLPIGILGNQVKVTMGESLEDRVLTCQAAGSQEQLCVAASSQEVGNDSDGEESISQWRSALSEIDESEDDEDEPFP